MKSKIFSFSLLAACLLSPIARAEPTSSPLSLSYLRPYGAGNAVYVGANILPGAFCASNVFMIDLSSNTGKAMYAAALAAILSGKLVRLELLTCAITANDVSQLQSLYILP